jgi:hypothetical protein
MIAPFGSVFRVGEEMGINTSGSSFVQHEYNSSAIIAAPKSDIKLRVISASTTDLLAAGSFDIHLVRAE